MLAPLSRSTPHHICGPCLLSVLAWPFCCQRTFLKPYGRCAVHPISQRIWPPTFLGAQGLDIGVTPLNDQELRNCIYQGSLNDLLDELATSQQWLTLINRTAPDNRLRDHELILRFFALNDAVDDYRPPLKKVLNDYMKKNRSISEDAKQGLRYQFQSSLGNVGAVFANRPFRRIRRTSSDVLQWDTNLNRPVFDIQMLSFVGLPYEEVAQRREVFLERFRDLW